MDGDHHSYLKAKPDKSSQQMLLKVEFGNIKDDRQDTKNWT